MDKSVRRVLTVLGMVLLAFVVAASAFAGGKKETASSQFLTVAPGVKRSETLILDQIFRYTDAGNFNLWNPSASTPTRQTLGWNTIWYVDQTTGEWRNALASEKPVYSNDYKEMTVHLRKGLYWSDGVEFTADDVVYTVKTLMDHPQLNWGAQLKRYVANVEEPDKYTVVFHLTASNPRFALAMFTSRYNACYIMPKHVFEKVSDPVTFKFNPPVSLSAYVFEKGDPNGQWELWKRREDWQRTPSGVLYGEPAPKYILTIFYGPNEKTVLAMLSGKLDMFMDVVPEAWNSLEKKSKTAFSWSRSFPQAWRGEQDSRVFGFNNSKPPYNEKDVRWALALSLDIVSLDENYLGGVPRLNVLPEPIVPSHFKAYFEPLQPWLKNLTIDVGNGETFQPYDTTAPEKIAAWAKQQGYTVSSDVEAPFGFGWWKHAPEVATRLLEKHGFKKDANGKWLLPDGTPWQINILAAPDEVDAYRLATGAANQWTRFGIDAKVRAEERTAFYNDDYSGNFDVSSDWGGAITASGFQDKWPFINGLNSAFYKPTGVSNQIGRYRIKSDALDTLLNNMESVPPDSGQDIQMGQDFMKMWVENMWGIVTVGFKKNLTYDTTYWTNFPTASNPYTMPAYWFMGGKFMFPQIKPAGPQQ